jgi:hypothetical protein
LRRRFDAKLEQGIAQGEAQLEQRIVDARAELLGAISVLDVRLVDRLAMFEGMVRRELHAQTRFLYLAWAVQLAAIVGLYAR